MLKSVGYMRGTCLAVYGTNAVPRVSSPSRLVVPAVAIKAQTLPTPMMCPVVIVLSHLLPSMKSRKATSSLLIPRKTLTIDCQ
jgi:hypothetical protein